MHVLLQILYTYRPHCKKGHRGYAALWLHSMVRIESILYNDDALFIQWQYFSKLNEVYLEIWVTFVYGEYPLCC